MAHQELKHKAAGHDGTMTDEDGTLIFKPMNEQELKFYDQIYQYHIMHSLESKSVPLISWMPTYMGKLDEGQNLPKNLMTLNQNPDDKVTVITDGSDIHLETNKISEQELNNSASTANKKYLVLENLLNGFKKPNVMDIKLGKILYDENATEEKKLRLQLVSKTTTSGSLGFRICGMKIQKNRSCSQLDEKHFSAEVDPETNEEYIFVNKFLGRTRNDSNVSDAIKLYFDNDNLTKERKLKLFKMFHSRLQHFYNTLLNYEIRLISSSLLFVYEGDPNVWDSKNDEDLIINDTYFGDSDSDDDSDSDNDDPRGRKVLPLSTMSLIDFAHSKCTPGQGYDENVIVGVESLINVFAELIASL